MRLLKYYDFVSNVFISQIPKTFISFPIKGKRTVVEILFCHESISGNCRHSYQTSVGNPVDECLQTFNIQRTISRVFYRQASWNLSQNRAYSTLRPSRCVGMHYQRLRGYNPREYWSPCVGLLGLNSATSTSARTERASRCLLALTWSLPVLSGSDKPRFRTLVVGGFEELGDVLNVSRWLVSLFLSFFFLSNHVRVDHWFTPYGVGISNNSISIKDSLDTINGYECFLIPSVVGGHVYV